MAFIAHKTLSLCVIRPEAVNFRITFKEKWNQIKIIVFYSITHSMTLQG